MPSIATTSHHTFARFTLAGVAHAIGTTDAVRAGVEHVACLGADAELGEQWVEEVARGGRIALRVLNRADLSQPLLAEDFTPLLTEAGDPLLTEFGPFTGLALSGVDGLSVTVESVTGVIYDDGTSAEFARTQTLTCVARERQAGSVTLTLVDIEDERLNTLYPPRLLSPTDFPDLSSADAGRTVPRVFGTALKMQAALVKAGPAEWDYLFDEFSSANALTVYRGKSAADARIVPPAEYTVHTGPIPFAHQLIRFTTEQRDFDGSLFQIFVDVEESPSDWNAGSVLQDVVTVAGATFNAASLAAFSTFCSNEFIHISCDFGRDGQRTCRSIIEDLLYLGRATMTRNAAGEYAITTDGSGASTMSLDEDAGDDIEVLAVSEPVKPTSVGVVYRPSPRDPNALQFTLTRAVPGGSLSAERPRELRYLRTHSRADRTVCYRAARAALAQRLRARVYRRTLSIGDVITVTSAAFGVHDTQWRVRDLKHIVGGLEIEATPYDASLTTYTAGTLPADAVDAYQPDYSNTPPLAPTGFRITATASALQGDGTLVARVTADTIPPTVNWESLWIAAIHNTTSEVTLGRADDVGAGRYGLTLTGLRPGEVYQLKAYAVNAFGVQGVVQGTFDATAIGGGGAVTTFTTAGYATLPADVASITGAQGTGKLVNVTWPAVSTANLREYVLERRIGAGSYSEVWRGQALSYVDRDVAYGSTYNYRVKARDTYGNLSTNWATSANVSLSTGTVLGGTSGNDIGSSTVSTNNRTSVSTVSISTGSSSSSTLFQNDTVAHSLGRVPIATVSGSTGVNSISSVGAMDSSNITVTTFCLDAQSNNNNVAGDPHHHMLVDSQGLPFSFTVYVDIW